LILILLGLQGFSQETKSAVLQRIDKNVYENITHQMRGDSLNAVLKAMVNSLASYTVSSSSGSITPTSVTTQTIIINNSGIATYTIAPRDSTTVIPNTKWCEQNFVKSVGEIAGNGIGITGVSPIVGYGTYTVTNTAPDKTVILTGGAGMSVTSGYPSFTVTNTSPFSGVTATLPLSISTNTISLNYGSGLSVSSGTLTATGLGGTVTSVGEVAGTGISIGGSSPITGAGTFTVTNTAPDQTVVLNNGTGISVTGTYPTFTVTNTAPNVGVGTVTSVTSATGDATVATTTTTPVITIVSAPKLTTGRTISGTGDATFTTGSFDGSGNGTGAVTVVKVQTTSVTTNATYYPLFAPTSSNGSNTVNVGTGITFNPSTNNLTTTTFTGALTGNVTGNATTAATLLTARNIWGQSFNGSANVTGSLTSVTTIATSSDVSVGGNINLTGAIGTTKYIITDETN